MRVGLTGGIASGKSAAARCFAELGVPVIDTDVIAREVVEPGSVGLDGIRQRFGDAVIRGDGELDRGALRNLVSAEPAEREALEAILHPLIREETMRQAHDAGGDYQVIVVPLLVESPLKHFVDRILVIDCSEETQIARLIARDGGDASAAQRILDAQASRQQRLDIADDVVDNEGSLDELEAEIRAQHRKYLELSAISDN